MRLFLVLSFLFSYSVHAVEVPSYFKIQCEQYSQKLTFELDRKYPKYFSVNNGANDLNSVTMTENGGLTVSFTTTKTSMMMRKNPKYTVLHQLNFYKDNSGSYHIVTLNENKSEVVSVVSSSTSYGTSGQMSNCISIGIW